MVAPPKARRGCVYWVDFEPVRGSEQGKRRPALVIQNNIGNMTSDVTTVIAITSQVPNKRYPMHVSLTLLGRPAVILCEQIRTVSLERVDPNAIAELPPELMAEVEEAIHRQLGFSAETASS
jgi:mRNA interferase MazF